VRELDAVLFDLFDTLAWTKMPRPADRITTRFGVTAETLSRAFDVTRRARHTGALGCGEQEMLAVVRSCGVEADLGLVRDVSAAQIAYLCEDGAGLYDDTLPALRTLRARGIRTAIVSNCDHWTRPVVGALALDGEVDAIVLSCEVGVMKPDAAIYHLALERLGVPPERALFVDDKAENCAAARALGLGAHLIARDGVDPGVSGTFDIIRGLDRLR
jgi:epoxide hydrolase-like predicted phosphatase